MEIEAVLDQQQVSLPTVLNLKVGDRFVLDCTANSPVALRCGDVVLFEGSMGRQKDRMAVKVSDVLYKKR